MDGAIIVIISGLCAVVVVGSGSTIGGWSG
jgi:hypothetical protein